MVAKSAVFVGPTEWEAPEILAFLRNRIDISADGASFQRATN